MTQEFEDRITELIGTPYDENNFHCWTLVETLVPNAPKLDVQGGDFTRAAHQFKKEVPKYIEMYHEVLEDPQNFDIVLAGSKFLNHAGVLIIEDGNALVIHNDINGVHVEPLYFFRKKYPTIKVMRCLS